MSGTARLLLLEYQPTKLQLKQQQPPPLPSLSLKTPSVSGRPQDLALRRAATSYTLGGLAGRPKQHQQKQPPPPKPRPVPQPPPPQSSMSNALLTRQRTSNDFFKLSSSRARRSTSVVRSGGGGGGGVWGGYWAMDSAGVWEAEERAQQRRRIYALNKLMTELEEANYLAFKASQQAKN